MKKIALVILGLCFLIPASLFAQTATKAAKPEKPTKEELTALLRPVLEGYAVTNPSTEVRVWCMGILMHLKDVDENDVTSLPMIIQQLNSKNETLRLVAAETIRQMVKFTDDELKDLMKPIFVDLAKTAKEPEIKKLAIEFLGITQDLDAKTLKSLPLLFDLAKSEDPDVKQTALTVLQKMVVDKQKSAAGAGGGAGGPMAGM